MTATPPDQPVTFGQAVQLERIPSAAWVLIGERPAPLQPATYRLRERSSGKQIHDLTPAIVGPLERAG